MQDVDNRGNLLYEYGNSVLSSQFLCKFKPVLKNKVFKIKQKGFLFQGPRVQCYVLTVCLYKCFKFVYRFDLSKHCCVHCLQSLHVSNANPVTEKESVMQGAKSWLPILSSVVLRCSLGRYFLWGEQHIVNND